MRTFAFFDLEGWERPILETHFPSGEFRLELHDGPVTALHLPDQSDAEVLSVFTHSRLVPEALDRFPNLKLVVTRSTGYDHIPLDECKKRGIAVSYVPGYGDNTVAEFAFGLILALMRKVYQAVDQIKETRSFALSGLRGSDLKGKTLGVVGTGRIGREVIKIGNGFSMHVIATDPYPNATFAAKLGFAYVSLEELLKNSDVITLHAPYTQQTHHLINKGNIGLIKKGAFLVNTARGGLVETEALVEALKNRTLAGAGLDVLEEEGEVKDELAFLANGHPNEEQLKTMLLDHVLMEMQNVLITPHNAFNTNEALERILAITIEDIKKYFDGAPVNLVPETS